MRLLLLAALLFPSALLADGSAIRLVAGSTQYLTATAPPVTATPMSMSVWFYSENTVTDTPMMYIQDDGTTALDGFFMTPCGSCGGTLAIQNFAGSGGGGDHTLQTVAPGYSALRWQHACGTVYFSLQTLKSLFLNGTSNSSSATPVGIPAGITQMFIGRVNNNGASSYGTIKVAEAAVWRTNLTSTECTMLSTGQYSPNQIRPEALAGSWKLDNPGMVPDSTNRLPPMTVTNSPTSFPFYLPTIRRPCAGCVSRNGRR